MVLENVFYLFIKLFLWTISINILITKTRSNFEL